VLKGVAKVATEQRPTQRFGGEFLLCGLDCLPVAQQPGRSTGRSYASILFSFPLS
jgi:hypothetical protein